MWKILLAFGFCHGCSSISVPRQGIFADFMALLSKVFISLNFQDISLNIKNKLLSLKIC
jgi:hypothetical protein